MIIIFVEFIDQLIDYPINYASLIWVYVDTKGQDRSTQSDQGLHYLLTESLDTTEFMNREQSPGCADDLTAHFAYV